VSSLFFELRDQDFSEVSRPRPRPWPPGLKTETKTFAFRSRVNKSSRPYVSRSQVWLLVLLLLLIGLQRFLNAFYNLQATQKYNF